MRTLICHSVVPALAIGVTLFPFLAHMGSDEVWLVTVIVIGVAGFVVMVVIGDLGLVVIVLVRALNDHS